MKNVIFTLILLICFVLPLKAKIMSVGPSSNEALRFDGSTNCAAITDNTIDMSADFTVECWVKFNRLGTLEYIFVKNDNPSLAHGYTLECGIYKNTDNKIYFLIGSSTAWAWHRADGNTTVNTSTWYHIAAVIQSTTMNLYINGVLDGTASHTDLRRSDLNSANVYLGCDLNGSGSPANFLDGKLDEVRIWNTARTEADIKANMFRSTIVSANLLANYRMDEGSGSNLPDYTGHGNDGTISGVPVWITAGAFADCRNALDFDGSDDYIDCGNGASVQRNGTQPVTVEAWVKPSVALWGTIISKFQHDASHEGYSLEMFSDYRVAFLFGNNWTNWEALSSTTTLPVGVWSHIAATYDGSTAKLYINGRLDASLNYTGGITDSGTDLFIGARMGTSVLSTFFSGQIDEARVWTVARAESDIQESMCRTLAGDEVGLAAYFRLDQTNGATTYDLTNNANNGTLTNMDPSTDWITSDAFNTWIGCESSSWSDAGNWSKGTVPSASNSVGVYKWNLGNEAVISSSPTVKNLYLASTASPTLSSPITVNTNLILAKDFDLNGQTITLGSSAYLVEGSSTLFGTSGTITTTRTLGGLSTVDIAGLGAKITTSASMGSTTIARGHAQQSGNGNVSILRYYDITPTNNTSLNATLVFNYKDSELNSLTEDSLILFKSTNAGTSWTNQAGIINTGSNILTKTGIASFSRWTLAKSTAPLTGPPDAPVATAASSITQTSFNANWGPVARATAYYLDVATDTAFAVYVTGFNNKNVGSDTIHNVNGLSAGTVYYYRVRAFNLDGASSNSNRISVTTKPETPVAVSPSGVTETSFSANWITAAGAQGYRLDVSLDSSFAAKVAGYDNRDVGNVTTLLVNSGILSGKIYYYRVLSYCGSELSGYSNTVWARTSTYITSPILSNIEVNPLEYTEGSNAVVITNTIVVSEVDDDYLQSAAVRIFGNYQSGEDELSFTSINGITGTWDLINGELIMSGTASLADYKTALRTVKFRNTSVNPGVLHRTISFSVNDGVYNSNDITRNIIISKLNSQPIITGIEESVLSYTEGSDTVRITNTIEVNDIDDNYLEGAAVQITDNYKNGEDELSFINKNGITGKWYSMTGKLVLSGSASVSDYQLALRAVKYRNTSDDPVTLERTISFCVNDGDIDSDTLKRTIEVIPAAVTDIDKLSTDAPREFYLSQNYPNPFNPATKIRYSIPSAGTVLLKVYNILGREVATLVHKHMPAGVYEVDFNCSNLSSGVYFYEITCREFSQMKKMIFLK